ncbi:replication factor A protein 3 [Lipomyces arxii]|uniref:replication factor A protein 3 n=1 Tax=Lipomyces arxii TaxID=56418 RepID=UPI0034CD5746
MSDITPRITAQLLQMYQGRVVRLIGKLTDIRGNSATLDSAGSVNVSLARGVEFQQGHFYEVIGRVNPDLSLQMLDGVDFGTNIDMDNAIALANLSQKYPEIFFNR